MNYKTNHFFWSRFNHSHVPLTGPVQGCYDDGHSPDRHWRACIPDRPCEGKEIYHIFEFLTILTYILKICFGTLQKVKNIFNFMIILLTLVHPSE